MLGAIVRGTPRGRIYVFDSHGSMWALCAAEHPEAQAFGPAGCARECSDEEVEGLVGPLRPADTITGRETPWSAAARVGLLIRAEEAHEWDLLDYTVGA